MEQTHFGSPADVETENKRTKKTQEESFAFKDVIEILVRSIVLVIVIFTFFGRIVGVIGDSMYPTLHNGDRLIISNFMYEPKQGDIVVVSLPDYFSDPIIKRIIAAPGQTIDIDFETGTVTVDGEVLQEDYINDLTYRSSVMQFPITVGEDEYFVMGDNRNRSEDSRTVGCVKREEIMGKAYVRLYPFTLF